MAKKSLMNWLDKNLLFYLAGFLLVFIPLYPKIPLYSPIEEYIVRVRIEDIAVVLTIGVWLVQLLRKKIKWQGLTSWLILGYALAGALSVFSAIFVLKSVPLIDQHIIKTVLHYLRYLEYFSLFFILLGTVTKREQVVNLVYALAGTLVVISLYGFGQKYFYWPVYSTMNREFSKGVRLYLTEHARVQSTFAGHYDLAAYLVIVLPLVLALAFNTDSPRKKWLMLVAHFLGVWLLIMSASRTSFGAYGLASLVVVGLQALKQKTWWKKFKWFGTRFTALWVAIFILLAGFGSDIYERFEQVIYAYPQIGQPYQQIKDGQGQVIAQVSDWLNFEPERGQPPENSISTEEAEVIVASDQRPVTERPVDVYVDIPDKVWVSTASADGTVTTTVVEKPRVWSENALEYGLSVAIRLDSLWPRAINGFLRSPLLGSGYGTLNKTSLTDFTIADSTDNNFLRTLGETGLLGFLTFYGAIVISLVLAAGQVFTKDKLMSALSIGYVAATLGLLLNAFYIDVFASSKVAFTFWALTGILMGYYQLQRHAKRT